MKMSCIKTKQKEHKGKDFMKFEDLFQGKVSREEGNEMLKENQQREPQTPTLELRRS